MLLALRPKKMQIPQPNVETPGGSAFKLKFEASYSENPTKDLIIGFKSTSFVLGFHETFTEPKQFFFFSETCHEI